MWRTGMRMIDANPWFGVGPQLVGPRFDEFQPVDVVERPLGYYGHLHNMPIHYAAERGIPAAILLAWFLLKVLWDHASAAGQARRRGAELTWLLHGVAAATVGVMVVGLSDIALGDSEMLGVYLTLVAVGYRAIELNGGTANPAS
jgi:O-antigen ligase